MGRAALTVCGYGNELPGAVERGKHSAPRAAFGGFSALYPGAGGGGRSGRSGNCAVGSSAIVQRLALSDLVAALVAGTRETHKTLDEKNPQYYSR